MSVHIPDALLQSLAEAQRIVVLTGAGISAESGVPTFREAQTDAWAQYDPKELATPQAFMRNPRLVWEWYAWRRSLIQKARPNLAHYALVDLEQALPTFLLVTQNIDGFHWLAGSRDMIELHGNIARTKCFDEGDVVSWWPETGDIPPHCPYCDGPLRPDVVMFGEGIPEHLVRTAFDAATGCDVFLCIGTSALVQPTSRLPLAAKRMGAQIVEINPTETALGVLADWSLRGQISDVLPTIVRALDFPTNAIDGAQRQ